MRGTIAMALLVAALTTGRSPAAAQQAPPATSSAINRSMVVLGFDALGMDAVRVARLETLFRMELERLAGSPTPSPREVSRVLKGSPLRNCGGENSCLAAIGKKLAVQVVVAGNVAELGDSYVINIKAVDAQNGRELRRIASDPLRGNPDELIEAIRVAAYRLLAPERLLGSITVLADIAGAEVKLDGKAVGRTPLPRALGNLGLGPHKLEVTAGGYSPFAEEVQVRFQKTTRVLVTLAAEAPRKRVDLTVPTGPPGPAPRRWYNNTWFIIGAGVAAVLIGGTIGYSLAQDEVIDCTMAMDGCR